MKKLILTLTCMLGGITMMAAPLRTVAIHQADGQVFSFAFTERPVVTYSGSDLVLTTSKTTVQYPIYMLKKLVIDEDYNTDVEVATDLSPLNSHLSTPQFGFEGETLTISGGEPGSTVSLYNIQGIVVGQYRLDSEGCATIPLQGMAKDVYIVKSNRLTFKFRKS